MVDKQTAKEKKINSLMNNVWNPTRRERKNEWDNTSTLTSTTEKMWKDTK